MVVGKVSHKVGSTWILRNRRLPSRVVAGDSSIFGVLASYPLCVLRVHPRVLRVLRFPRFSLSSIREDRPNKRGHTSSYGISSHVATDLTPQSTPFTPSIFLVLANFEKNSTKNSQKRFRPIYRFVEFFVVLIHGFVALGPCPTFYSATFSNFNHKNSGLEEKFEIPENPRKFQENFCSLIQIGRAHV